LPRCSPPSRPLPAPTRRSRPPSAWETPTAEIAAGAFGLAPIFAVIGVDGFQEGFTHTADITAPVAPAPWGPTAGWSVVRHQRDPASWYEIEPMMAWHGTKCERPDDPTPAKRTHRSAPTRTSCSSAAIT
jgi:hypothetical protein